MVEESHVSCFHPPVGRTNCFLDISNKSIPEAVTWDSNTKKSLIPSTGMKLFLIQKQKENGFYLLRMGAALRKMSNLQKMVLKIKSLNVSV